LANKIGQGGFGEVYYGELRGKVCNHWHRLTLHIHLKEKLHMLLGQW
jgi:hypothetical protein